MRLADRLGLIPPIPDSLYEAAEKGRSAFGAALMAYAQKEPAALKVMPFILGKALGRVLDSVHLAALWGILQMTPKAFQEEAARAGFTPGPELGEALSWYS
jgi:hypothetical protein